MVVYSPYLRIFDTAQFSFAMHFGYCLGSLPCLVISGTREALHRKMRLEIRLMIGSAAIAWASLYTGLAPRTRKSQTFLLRYV